jgi:hypothetical protein
MILRIVAAGCLVVALAGQGARAAEGGYSNYLPGTYGDFGMALAPTEKWTLRNDVYFYDASASRSVLSGDIVARRSTPPSRSPSSCRPATTTSTFSSFAMDW